MLATIQSGNRIQTGIELASRSLQVATALQANGLTAGDTIALMLHNDIAFIELMLGAEQAGVTYVPLNWHAAQNELQHIIKDSNAKAIFVHADLYTKIAKVTDNSIQLIVIETPPEVASAFNIKDSDCVVPDNLYNYEQWLKESANKPFQPKEKLFQLLYTSGSTGMPKGVLRKRSANGINQKFAKIARIAHGLEIRPIRAVMTGPLYHSAPNSYALNTIRFGELLVLQPKFNAKELLGLIAKYKISHLHMVPTMFKRLLALPKDIREQADVSSLRSITHGSSRCEPDVKQKMIDWWGPIIYEYYASTETGIITMIDSYEWANKPGSVGKPHPDVKIRIVGEDGQTLAPQASGEIQLKSDVIPLIEYKNMPEETAKLVHDGWANTGDIGYIDEDGYLWLSDRKKDLIISGGVNIYPAEIELCLCSHPEVSDAIAFSIYDSELGEAIGALVEPSEGSTITENELTEYVHKKLGGLRTPKHIFTVKNLNRTDTGKLKRNKVRELFLQIMNQKEASANG